MNDLHQDVRLSCEQAEVLLNSENQLSIEKWNTAQDVECYPLAWDRNSVEAGRGFTIASDTRTYLFDVIFSGLNFGTVFSLNRCVFEGAYFSKIEADRISLIKCEFIECTFEELDWADAKLCGSVFRGCIFNNCSFTKSDFSKASFLSTERSISVFENISLEETVLESVSFNGGTLRRSKFDYVILDGRTFFQFEDIDKDSTFNGMSVEMGRISPSNRASITRSLRANYWKEFLGSANMVQRFGWQLFWGINGYELSLKQLFRSVLVTVVFFSLLVYLGARQGAFVLEDQVMALNILQATYFVLVTMTTLGYGEIRPATDSDFGYVLVILMVSAGYFLFSSLIARIVVTAQWPE